MNYAFSLTNKVNSRSCTNVGHAIAQFLLFYLPEKYNSGEFFCGVHFLSTFCPLLARPSSSFQLFYFLECFLSFKVAFVVRTDYRYLKFLFLHQSGENLFGKKQPSKSSREQFAIPGADSPIGFSDRCPRDWFHREKKTFGIAPVNPKENINLYLFRRIWSNFLTQSEKL